MHLLWSLSYATLPKAKVGQRPCCLAQLAKEHIKVPTVKVVELDMDDFDSTQCFAKAIKAELPVIDHLLLNAGIAISKHETSPSRYEHVMQVKYLSNVLLVLKLPPQLEASAASTGAPSRIAWVRSRRHPQPTLSNKAIGNCCTQCFCTSSRHAWRRNKIIFNSVYPGMVDPAMSHVLPIYLRIPVNIMKMIRARPVEHRA